MLYDSVDTYCHSALDDNSVRMNKHDELSDFSSQSILCAMDRFVKAVNNMNETVMVPCRLLDMEVESKTSGEKVPVLLRSGGNPYSYYSVLNSVKNDLIWGPTSNDDDDNDNSASTTNNTRWSDPVAVSSAASTTSSASSSSGHVKGHMRRQSTLSMISMSSNASDGDSEGGCDGSEGGDSGVEAEDITPELTAAALTNNLRTHLLGLHTCLSNLTDTASFITERYQEEVNV
ncbi:mid1-interacting protein 1-like isoform X2 [Penaeus japonicus]|uniref:mid1-interacting protein 1-like isoform X2 n=1 Tax=Penaeus japonicus TaxID=27405 RepID=UPI001C70CCA4|nr:mid1-interacting protein 1-like isoform X2 [Penaeus japonicus]